MAIETNELIDVQTLPPFKKFIMSIGAIPTSYLESMSYAEMLAWFCNYLQNTVIPTVNNNGEAVEELQDLFVELKSYVDDYFENLDVQEEINIKLDQMAENGTLTTLIKNYIDPIYTSYETRINNRVDEIDSKVTSATSGSPLVASSTSGMTDTTKVYVNTTDGKWYYYDGDSWEIGGTYQSTGIADGSINFYKLDNKLQNEIGFTSNNPIEYRESVGISGSTGLEYTASTRFTSNLVSLNNIKITALTDYEVQIYIYNSAGTYENGTGWQTANNYIYEANDTKLYRISFRKGNDAEDLSSDNFDDVSITNYSVKSNVNTFNLDSKLLNALNLTPVTVSWEQGSINGTTGEGSTSSTRIRTSTYLKFDSDLYLKTNPNYYFMIFEYDYDYSFIGRKPILYYSYYKLTTNQNHYYKLVYSKMDNSAILVTDASNCEITGYITSITSNPLYLKNLDPMYFKFNDHGYNEGSYASGCCLVKDLFIEFGISQDDHADYSSLNIYKIDLTNKTAEYIKTIEHNFGHVNSVSYNDATDSLIFGNGSGDFTQKGKFYIYENFYSKLVGNYSRISINACIEYDCTSYDFGNEYKFNVIWGDSNNGQNNIAILVTNNYRTIRKLLLGKTTNQLELGTYNSGATQFNGTFKIINEYHQTTGTATGTDNTYAVQDLSWYNDKLYGGVGHQLNMYWEMELNEDGSITRKEHVMPFYNADGTKDDLSIGAICKTRDYLIINIGDICILNQ